VTDQEIKNLQNQTTLNPILWSLPEEKLKPEVRTHLIKIAEDFFQDLDIPWASLEDVRLTGSSANYNWSKYSDIDLHLIVDYSLVDENYDFAKAYFDARKKLWNLVHDIEIKGLEVEVYIEDLKKSAISSGVYSVLHDEWLKKPLQDAERIEPMDEKLIMDKVKFLINMINDVVVKNMNDGNYKTAVEQAEKISNKIKKMRQRGLEKDGEFAVENLAFKILRRKGMIEKLHDIKLEAYDKLMSL
jgi:predicted nucleotidyltransferase